MTRVCEYAAARGLRGFTDIRAAGNSGILGNRNDVFTLSGEYARIGATTLPTQFKKKKKKRILYLKINISFARSSHEVKPHSHSFRFIRRCLKQRQVTQPTNVLYSTPCMQTKFTLRMAT